MLSASKSYSERLFRYVSIDRLDRESADVAVLAPARREGADFEPDALDALYAAADGYPYFVQAYGKVTWDVAAASPVTAHDVSVAGPVAAGELAVGFFGSRYERATPAEREYMRAMATLGDDPVQTAQVAEELGRKPSSVSPGQGQPDQEGPDLQLRARADRVHGPALRPFPARPADLGQSRRPGPERPLPEYQAF